MAWRNRQGQGHRWIGAMRPSTRKTKCDHIFISCRTPRAIDRMSVAHVVVRLLETLANKNAFQEVENIAAKFMWVVREVGETPELVVAYFYQAMSLHNKLNIRKAHGLGVEALAIAERLADGRARAYARGWQLFTASFLALYPNEIAEQMKIKLIDDVLRFGDGFINNYGYFFVAWDYFYRGLNKDARRVAIRLIAYGEERKDPRAIGLANVILGWTKLADDDPTAAIVSPTKKIISSIMRVDGFRFDLGRYRFPPEIIHQAIWLYLRFTLSFRDVEDLLAERGIAISYETIRRWVNHFGP